MSCFQHADVTVIGAGLTGSCVALELAKQGLSVALLDQDPVPMNRASRRNEGKIHLGLIYAADPSFSTADLQLRGALSFYRLLERWLGNKLQELARSTPFTYLVAEDTLVSADRLAEHYSKLERCYRERITEDPDLSYLGTRPDHLARRINLDQLDSRLNAKCLAAAFHTSELAIDTDQLSDLIMRAVEASENIQFFPRHKVREISRDHVGFVVNGESPEGCWSLVSEQVVNAAWENRILLDSTLGLSPTPGWLYRLKYRLLAQVPESLVDGPSTTMVLGRYGDVVIRANGTAYLSWYPAGLKGWSKDLAPPADWEAACMSDTRAQSTDIVRDIIDGIKTWYPGVEKCRPYQLDAGAIVAYGKTDVDDPDSGLHGRTQVGVSSRDGYHSVDPGKLTTAPYFAFSAATKVAACADSPRREVAQQLNG
jgi:glycine/D-amino acid oxidase-like deaminating enzyme